MERGSFPNTRERFVVLADTFPAPGVRDARLRHQIAFVTGIDKDSATNRGAAVQGDLINAGGISHDPATFAQTLTERHVDASLFEQTVEDRLCDMRLEVPLDRPAVLRTDALE